MSKYAKIEGSKVSNIIACEDSNIYALGGFYIKITESTKNPIIGGEYDSINNKFIAPKPYDSWMLNSEFEWESPKGTNLDMLTKMWDEQTQDWVDRV
jgi:hypothetical protein